MKISKPQPSEDQEQADTLRQLDRDSMEALAAMTAAMGMGLLHSVILAKTDAGDLCRLQIRKGEEVIREDTVALTLQEAVIAAGKKLNAQLMLLHADTANPGTQTYQDGIGMRAKIREEIKPRILLPGQN